MKKITLLAALFVGVASFAQIASTSFEEPEAIGGQYTDTGDPAVAHDLVNNPDEPIIDFTSGGGEIGYDASYVPYDEPGDGLSDGDFVGVTTFTPTGDDPYPDGEKGYQISDADGNYILEFDSIDLAGTNSPTVSIDYFISETGYEGDGTENASGSDRIRIYVRDLTNTTEIDILDTTGNDINDLGIEGVWTTGTVDLESDTEVQLVIEVRCNSSNEAFFFDNVVFNQLLGLDDNNQDVFSVYPNPATNQVHISSATNSLKTVAIYNVLGKQVLSTTTTKTLDISMLASGIYLLEVNENGVSSTKKLVVK